MNRKRVSLFVLGIYPLIFFCLAIALRAVAAEPRIKKNTGKGCLDCHSELKKMLLSGNPHKPLKSEECISCHNPHTARYKYLLNQTDDNLCYGCHKAEKFWLTEKVVHLPVEYGECLKCHEPHVSQYPDLLRQKEKDVCYQCHNREGFEKAYVHGPIKEGRCNTCHKSHSSKYPSLLIQSPPGICFKCHPLNQKLASSHPGYQIDQVDCLLCHNPHSSTRKGLIYSTLHDPFEKNKCNGCHTSNSSGFIKPASGNARDCYVCHKDAEKGFNAKKRSHIVKSPDECIFCHNPHGSERKDLVKRDDRSLCTACHQDMGKRLRMVKKGVRRHPEVLAGNCSVCHDAHASNEIRFLREPAITLCVNCHQRQKVACHPVGEKALDPRSKTPIDCITCHNPMESEFPQIMRLDGAKDMCNQCHKY